MEGTPQQRFRSISCRLHLEKSLKAFLEERWSARALEMMRVAFY